MKINPYILKAYLAVVGFCILLPEWWHPYKGVVGYSLIFMPPVKDATIRVDFMILYIVVASVIAFFVNRKVEM